MRSQLNSIFLAVTTVFAQHVPLDLSGRFGEVEVVVVDPLGYPIPEPRFVVEQIRSGRVAKAFAGQRHMRLETGTYRLVIDTPGFRRRTKAFTIVDKPTLIVMAIPVATLEVEAVIPEITGIVPNLASQSKCQFVRLIPVFLDSPPLDAVVQVNGSFAIENVAPGKYVAIVFGSEGTCRSAELTITGWTRQHVVVDVPSRQ